MSSDRDYINLNRETVPQLPTDDDDDDDDEMISSNLPQEEQTTTLASNTVDVLTMISAVASSSSAAELQVERQDVEENSQQQQEVAPPSKKKARIHWAARWNNMYEELRAYKSQHGHCVVPLSYGPLGKWVDRQRQQYKKQWKGVRFSRTEDRRALLDQLGFAWSVHEHISVAATGIVHPSSNSSSESSNTAASTEQTDNNNDNNNNEDVGSASSTSKNVYKQLPWSERVAQLAQYKDQHGTCHVPYNHTNSTLTKWIDRQRIQYRRYTEGKPSQLTKERIEQLNQMGFVWSMTGPKVQTDWKVRLEHLKAYKEIHGDCLVSYNYPQDPSLGKWVEKQRSLYKHIQDGKPSQLSLERIDALNQIDFTWSLQTGWKVRYEELKRYKDERGDCLVSHNYKPNKALAKWCEKQRSQYKYKMEGKPSQLTDERIADLERIGFAWTVRPAQTRAGWDERLQQLKEYIGRRGDSLVPYNYQENVSLAKWVEKQRNMYKRRREGKSSQLTDYRVKALDELGFVWSLRPKDRDGNVTAPASSSNAAAVNSDDEEGDSSTAELNA